MTEHTIKTIIVVWDQCDLSFTIGGPTYSKMFDLELRSKLKLKIDFPIIFYNPNKIDYYSSVKQFLHGKKLVDLRSNKELALLKFCSGGFIDEHEKYWHLINEWRNRSSTIQASIERCICLIFLTADKSTGMQLALDWYNSQKSKSIKLANKHLLGVGQMNRLNNETDLKTLVSSIAQVSSGPGIHF